MNDESDFPDQDNEASSEADAQESVTLLDRLRLEHRRIDQEIDALIETGVDDMLKIRRMKKIRLSLKDQIAYLENQIIPDIIA